MSNELHINQNICVLRIELEGSEPRIWRRVAVPARFSLGRLHEVIQLIMPWDDYHLHEFKIGNKSYGVPEPDYGDKMLDEESVTLQQVFRDDTTQIEYIYDFGDGWLHTIDCESITPAELEIDEYPTCLDGAMASPPEDSGALFGYYRKLKILQDPEHEEHEFIKEWMPIDFDPEYFDLDAANNELKIGDITDEELDEAEQTMLEVISSTCAWCGQDIDDDSSALTQFLKMKADLKLDATKGSFAMMRMGADERDVFAYVIPDDAQAKKEGKDIAILLCGDECSKDLQEALTYTFGGPFPNS